MTDIAIRVENLGKKYRIGSQQQQYKTLRDVLSQKLFNPKKWVGGRKSERYSPSENSFWALEDISFEVLQGQVLGVIGKNGAGKSTLLKILSRVTEPTRGLGEIHGRVGSLLEVGTGFHPELTGRENIFLNGAILGMKRVEITRKFDEIVEFSEISKFIDTPVKRYSSGMYLRLAFAVAAHLEPEILVVDEVLAVGDAEFQRKCLGKMSDVAQQGRTVLFVSHNMSAILRLTQEAIVLEKGQLALRAPSAEAVDYYLSQGFSQHGERTWSPTELPQDSTLFYPVAIRTQNVQGKISDLLRSVEPVVIEIEYTLKAPLTGLRVGIYLSTTRGELIFTSFDTDDPSMFESYPSRPAGHYISRAKIPANFLNEGRYVIGINASSYRIQRYFQDDQSLAFGIDAAGAPGMQWPEPRGGVTRPQLQWQIESLDR
jgi:lipopolysaccharide transport system ATP-binding protein